MADPKKPVTAPEVPADKPVDPRLVPNPGPVAELIPGVDETQSD